jgi:hypothetical protein
MFGPCRELYQFLCCHQNDQLCLQLPAVMLYPVIVTLKHRGVVVADHMIIKLEFNTCPTRVLHNCHTCLVWCNLDQIDKSINLLHELFSLFVYALNTNFICVSNVDPATEPLPSRISSKSIDRSSGWQTENRYIFKLKTKQQILLAKSFLKIASSGSFA